MNILYVFIDNIANLNKNIYTIQVHTFVYVFGERNYNNKIPP